MTTYLAILLLVLCAFAFVLMWAAVAAGSEGDDN